MTTCSPTHAPEKEKKKKRKRKEKLEQKEAGLTGRLRLKYFMLGPNFDDIFYLMAGRRGKEKGKTKKTERKNKEKGGWAGRLRLKYSIL